MKKVIVINSNDRVSGTASDFTVQLKDDIYSQNIFAIGIQQISIPNTVYNINSLNNTFQIKRTVDINFTTYIIPQGQYTVGELLSYLNATILLSGGAIFTASQTPITFKIRFNVDLPGYSFKGSLGDAVGFLSDTTYTIAGSVFDMPFLPNLVGADVISVHSRKLAENRGIDSDSGAINLIDVVSMSGCGFGSYCVKRFDPEMLIAFDSPRNLSTIDIRLRLNQGDIIDIGICNFNMIFTIYNSLDE